MRFTRDYPAQAGTSVIAALMVAAVLGVIAFGLNALESGSTNTGALPAATEQSQSKTPEQIQQACDAAKKSALGRTESMLETDTYKLSDVSNIDNACVSAILIAGKSPSQNPADYQCVGKLAELEMGINSDLQANLQPSQSVPAGTCKTSICDSSGNNCTPASLAGLNATTLGSAGLTTSGYDSGVPAITPDTATANAGPLSSAGCPAGTNPATCQAAISAGQSTSGQYPQGNLNSLPECAGDNATSLPCQNAINAAQAQAGSNNGQFPPVTNNGNNNTGDYNIPGTGGNSQPISCDTTGCSINNAQEQKFLENNGYTCSQSDDGEGQYGVCLLKDGATSIASTCNPNFQTNTCTGTPGPTPAPCTTGNCGTTPQPQGPCQNGQTVNSTGGCGTTTQTPPGQTPQSPQQRPPTSQPSTIPPQQQQQCSTLSSIFGCTNQQVSCQMTAQPNPVQRVGTPATLTWTTTGTVYSASLSGVGVSGGVPVPSGSYSVYPQANSNYTLTVYSQTGQSASCFASVNLSTAAQNPYGTGTNGQACTQPPQQQQCPSGYTSQPTSSTGNGCTTGYQCVPGAAAGLQNQSPPSATISCSPSIADVGMSVAISYSCGNSTASSGGGFSTGSQLSGSTTTVIRTPPQGTNTANFGITCANQNVAGTNGQALTATQQCTVQINQPSITLATSPSQITSGSVAAIGWVTAGMQSCRVSSPTDTAFNARNSSSLVTGGIATTSALTANTEYDLTCQTLGGQTKSASTTVTVSANTNPASNTVTATSTADGGSINHGGTVSIFWQAPGASAGSAMALWLIDVQSERAVALIAGAQNPSGSFLWHVPAANDTCDQNSAAPCASDLIAGENYGIEATLYSPSNAYLGGLPAPANPVQPNFIDTGYTPEPFTVGQ